MANHGEHPNIVKIYGICWQPNHYLITEYMAKGTLKDYISKKPGHIELSMSQILDMFVKVSEALEFMHKKGRIHRNLNPNNILFDDLGTPKISGFEMASLYSNKDYYNT